MNIHKITISEAGLDDAPALALVLERANAMRDDKTIPESLANPQSIEEVLSRMHRMHARTMKAIVGGRVVGFVLSHPLIDPQGEYSEPDTEHVALLMVDPDYWGQHIASTLLDNVVEYAYQKSRVSITLWTDKHNNDRARHLYAHKGFELSGIERTDEGITKVQYRRLLR